MEFTQLRHFVVSAEHKNLSKAAEALNQSTSGISRSIKRLEGAVGGKLFERAADGLRLSELGTTLITYARAILNDHDRAIVAIDATRKKKSGVVRVGVVRYLADFAIPDAVTDFVRRHPKAGVEIVDNSHEELVKLLATADIDVVVTALTEPLADTDLHFESVINCDLIYVAGATHRLAQKKVVSVAELRQARMLISNRPHRIRRYYQNYADANQIKQHPVVVAAPTLTRQLLLRGEFITISPRHAVLEDLQVGRLVELRCAALPPPPIGILLRKKGVKSNLLNAFLRDIRSALRRNGKRSS
jgi:LysR family transcriptional regulator, pca operon transcriptional activator